MPQSQPRRLRIAFGFLFWEGAFAMVHDTWTGPTYLSGLAGELHAPVFWLSLLCSAAWIGAVGQLVGAWFYERVPSYKQYTVGLAAASRAMWLIPIFMAAFWLHRGRVTGAPFPVTNWFALTSVVACGAALLGASSAASWSSWMRALVPEKLRGRFFGVRQRYVVFGLIGANTLAAICVDWRPDGVFAGFALLGLMSVTAAGLSTVLLNRVQDAGVPKGDSPHGGREFLKWVAEPLRDKGFRGIVIYGAVFNGAMQFAGPYFPYYFTRELGFQMSHIAFWTVLTNLGCLLTAGSWGRYLDRTEVKPAHVMLGMGTLVALSPALYIAGGVKWVTAIAPWDYLTNGAFWVGYWLALTTLIYRNIPKHLGAALCFSIYTAAAGLCGAAGSLLGGGFAQAFQPWGGFRVLWFAATILRLAVIWGLYRLVKPESSTRSKITLVPHPQT